MSQCTQSGFQQVSGGACSLVMYPEAAPGCVEPGTKGVLLSFMNESLSRGSSKQQRQVITGKRGPGKPFEGLPQLGGGVEAASYAPQIGYLLRALCGKPQTTAESARPLDLDAAGEIETGIVGLPCAGHGFVQDAVITIHGTVNYDGVYRVKRGVTEDVIAIAAPFVAETFTAGAMVYRGRAPVLQGSAKDLGDGLVGLPVKGVEHALNAGESITVSGSVHYDGTYLLRPGTAGRYLSIQAAFAEEDFSGAALAVPAFYRHAFALPKRQPTNCFEKYLDFEDGAAGNKYLRFGFCKVNGWNFTFGGAEELRFNLDMAVGRREAAPEPLDAAPVTPPSVRMDNIECALWVAGVRRADVQSGTCSNAFGIEPQAAIGDRGQYSRMPEGDPDCSITMRVFLERDDYQALSENRATVPVSISNCCASGDEFWFTYDETELDVPDPSISGKQGLMLEVTAMPFVDAGETVLKAVIINRVASYA